jgi:chorismate-pyruvate lyase
MKYDILNHSDVSIRSQALPLQIREILQWVFYRYSNTAKIRKMAGFHLEVLSKRPHRDVRIYNGKNLLMYARTIADEATQQALSGVYSFQKPSPIGDFLFYSPDVKRKQVSLSISLSIPQWMRSYEKKPRVFWVRETVWLYRKKYPIILIEVFF